MSKAAKAAHDYARMTDVERCAFMGELMRRTWYARIFQPEKAEQLEARGYGVARDKQIPAWFHDDYANVKTHIWSAGRSSGKTRLAAEFVAQECLLVPNTRAALLAPDFKGSVTVGINGRSGIKTLIENIDPSLIVKFDKVEKVLELINGSQVFCYSSEYPKSMRGPEFRIAWIDEVATLYNAEECYREILEPAVRTPGENKERSRIIVTGTPKATELVKYLYDRAQSRPDTYQWTQMSSRDNAHNVDEQTILDLYEDTAGTTMQREELEGELLLEAPGSLVTESDLARIRVETASKLHCPVEDFDEVIVSIDASHADDAKSDETGITILGRSGRHAHLIADASGALSPLDWGERVVQVLVAYPQIRKVVVEKDGSLADTLLSNVIDKNLDRFERPIRIVRMSHGNKSKQARAEPVAALYQARRVLHDPCAKTPDWSDLSALEWQWKSWEPSRKGKGVKSPDRVDALVYGVTYLLLNGPEPDSLFSPTDIASWK